MIDVHCHLEQNDYDMDLDRVIESLKQRLKAVVSVATHPKHFEKALEIKRKNKDFVFLAAGIHPEYIKDISAAERETLFTKIKEHKTEIVSIGEAGLDFYWIHDEKRELQKKYFREDIEFARGLGKPVSVHSRDATDDTVRILIDAAYERVHWHLFKDRSAVPAVVKYGWMVSIGPLLLNSKTLVKIVQDVPLEQILLETDSPWWGGGSRGTPLNIISVAEKIAKIKNIPSEDVWEACGNNAVRFFSLKFQL